MDELDLWIVQSLIASKGCSSGALYESGKDRNLPLPALLATSDDFFATAFGKGSREARTREASVFMVEGGPPEFFVITGLTNPAIWYSRTYIDEYLRLREIIMAEKFEGATGHLFEALGAFYAALGNDAFARTCFLQALIETSSYAEDADYYGGCTHVASRFCLSDEPAQAPEAAIVALYFGLAHELGHLHDPNAPSAGSRQTHPASLDRNAIRDAVLTAGKDILKTNLLEYSYDVWAEKAEREFDDPKSILNIDGLRAEIVADWVGFQILLRFIEFISNRRRRTYNKKALVSEVVIGLFIIQLLEQCRHLAKYNLKELCQLDGDERRAKLSSIHVPLDMLEERHDLLRAQIAHTDVMINFAAGHRARVEFLKPTLQTCVLLHLFPDTFSVVGNTVVPRVGPAELSRRESIASQNLEGYFGFYQKAITTLLARFGDVSFFVAHLVAGSPPPEYLNPRRAGNLVDAILENFLIHVAQSEGQGESGRKRRAKMLDRFSHYVSMLKRRGVVDDALFSAHDGLLPGRPQD